MGEAFLAASVPTCYSRGRAGLRAPPCRHTQSQKSQSLSTPMRFMVSQTISYFFISFVVTAALWVWMAVS